jgi:WD40 repeat protein
MQHFLRELRMPVVLLSPSTPLSLSALHTPIFQRDPSYHHSHLYQRSSIQGLLKPIKMQRGKLLAWPTLPLEWIGHTGAIKCMSYSPDGSNIVTGSDDKTIRIWDAETGAVVGDDI